MGATAIHPTRTGSNQTASKPCHLRSNQRRIVAAPRQQFVVRPLLDDAPGVEHDNEVGVANGAQPVGDDNARAV